MISVGGTVVIGGDGGSGSGLPAGGAALQLLQRDAGNVAAWSAPATVVVQGLSAALAAQPVGTAILADGAGGLVPSDPVLSDLLTATTLVGARAALGVAGPSTTTTYDFLSATGFVAQPNSGTASITAGVARLSRGAGTAQRTAVVAYDGPAIYRALTEPTTGPFEVACRIAVAPSVPATYLLLEVATGLAGEVRVSVHADHLGAVRIYRQDTNVTSTTVAGAFASYTGEEWLRWRVTAAGLTAYVGVGVAGARPTAWTLIGTLALTGLLWSHVALGLVVVGTAVTSTVDVGDLAVLEPRVETL